MADRMWSALSDPHRRAMLNVLRRGECAVGDLVSELDMNQPQASKHLMVLREAGLVHVRKDAQRRVYALDHRPLSELDQWLSPYRDLWNNSLDRLGTHLEENP